MALVCFLLLLFCRCYLFVRVCVFCFVVVVVVVIVVVVDPVILLSLLFACFLLFTVLEGDVFYANGYTFRGNNFIIFIYLFIYLFILFYFILFF